MVDQQPRFLNINKLGSVDLAECPLYLRSFSGYEELSRLFAFDLEADCHHDKASALTAEAVLGQRIVFSTNHGSGRFFSGIVSEFALGNMDDEGLRNCQIRVVPELWKLTQMLNTRRFPATTVSELAEQIFEEASLDMEVDDRIDTDVNLHPARTNPVQYSETPLNFLGRHFEEESIFYYFRDDYSLDGDTLSGNQRLVMGDGADDYHRLIGADDEGNEVPLSLIFQDSGNVFSPLHISDWVRRFNFRPAGWTITDYDFHKSQDTQMAKTADGPLAQSRHFQKFRKAAGFYKKEFRDNKLACLMQREDAEREYIQGRSSCPFLFPGARFELGEHAADGEEGEYVVTSVEHYAVEQAQGEIDEFEYENSFTCIPADRVAITCPRGANRPPEGSVSGTAGGVDARTRLRNLKQRVEQAARVDVETTNAASGSAPVAANSQPPVPPPAVAETAFVCDRDGAYVGSNAGTVVVDSEGFGRVLIRYPWETDADWEAAHTGSDESTWRWVRSTQLSAGKQWGLKFLPRVGEEVIVVYLEGDVRRPTIVGSVYNDTYNHEGDTATEMERVKVETFNGGGWDSQSSPKPKFFNVADSPANHPLANGKESEPRVCPKLSDSEVSGLRTRTNKVGDDPQADDGNQLLFKDADGNEEIYVHAQKDFNLNVKGDYHVCVEGDKKEYIGGDYYRVVQCGVSSANGPVNRSVSEAYTFDLDATWGYTTFKPCSADSLHPVKVITEEYLDTETRTHGDIKAAHGGTQQDYFLGNSFEMHVAGCESLFFGGQFEFSVGLDIVIKGSVDVGYNLALKLTREDAFGYAKETMNKVDSGLLMESAMAKLEDTKLSVRKYTTDMEQVDVRISKLQTDMRQAQIQMLKTNMSILDTQIFMLKGMALFM